MSEMPKEVWAWKSHLMEGEISAKARQMDAPAERYIRANVLIEMLEGMKVSEDIPAWIGAYHDRANTDYHKARGHNTAIDAAIEKIKEMR